MEKLNKRKSTIKGQLTKILNYVTVNSKTASYDDLKVRLDKVNQFYNDFVEVEDHIFGIDSTVASEMSQIDDQYFALVAKLQSAIREKSMLPEVQASGNDTFNTSGQVSGPSSDFKLPRLELPTFSGNVKEWHSFYDIFKSTVHENTTLTPAQKFKYLRGLVKGEAYILIQHFRVDDANYVEAFQRLVQRYDKKKSIIDSYIKDFLEHPKISKPTHASVSKVHDNVDEVLRGLKALGAEAESRDPWIIYIALSKLDEETRQKWRYESTEIDHPKIKDFLKFLMKRMDSLMDIDHELKKVQSKPLCPSKSFHAAPSTNCTVCSEGDHRLYDCKKFMEMSTKLRRELVKNNSCCFNCLGSSHSVYQCRTKKRCQKCHKKHNTLLHLDPEPTTSQNDIKSKDNFSEIRTNRSSYLQPQPCGSSSVPRCNHAANNYENALLPTALIHVADEYGKWHEARALLDSASTRSFVTETFVNRLRLSRKNARLTIDTLNSSKAGKSKGVTILKIRSMSDTSFSFEVNSLIMPLITSRLPSKYIPIDKFKYLKGLTLADPEFNVPGQIDILIGCDRLLLAMCDGRVVECPEKPIAQNTRFGWIIGGMCDGDNCFENKATTLTNRPTEIDIDRTLRKFWEVEEMPPALTHTKDELACVKSFRETVRRTKEGRFVVSLPFRNDPPNLGESLTQALSRYRALERKLGQNDDLRQQYSQFLAEYESLGHMERVPNHEIHKSSNQVFYMPHHGVIKESSSTTRLRVVFDASAKSRSGNSLNDELFVGPQTQQTLIQILLRFRKHKFVFSADLEKMFRQILVSKSDSDYQRILWRENVNEDVRHYRLLTVTYGTAPASYIATQTLQELANINLAEFPEASLVLSNDFYMDDLMSGANDLETAIKIQNDLRSILVQGGFHLRKWSGNHRRLLEKVPHEDQEITLREISDGTKMVSVLGIQYQPTRDIFTFKVNLPNSTEFTKRQLSSEASRVFDPMGWLSPITVAVKIMFQCLWLTNLEWDDALPAEIDSRWRLVRNELCQLEQFEIPRWLFSEIDVKLHGFADASKEAYAAVIYSRTLSANGEVRTNIVAAKTRVAPIKTVTIPRLELCAATLLTRLMHLAISSLSLRNQPKIHLYSDSSTVLGWLSKLPKVWPTYVSNRTSEILTNSERNQWFYVPSLQNPADCASRGMTPSQLRGFTLWWQGPGWLRENPLILPSQQFNSVGEVSDLDVMPVVCATSVTSSSYAILHTLMKNCSSFRKMQNVICRILRLAHNSKSQNKSARLTGSLTVAENFRAESQLFRLIQADSFSEEIRLLTNNKPINKNSNLISFHPFVDANGLLRVGGRLEKADINYDAKHPIILPGHNRAVQLLVHQKHIKMLHAEQTLLSTALRQRLRIVREKDVVKATIRHCIKCSLQKNKIQRQLMGQLPQCRTHLVRAFLQTGIDYAGPFTLKAHRGRGAKQYKGYLAIFVCMATKAVHLDVVTDMSADTFIAALIRFQATRGICSDLFSDNGTNFVGASNQLRQLHDMFQQEASIQKITDWCITEGTRWHFIPPGAPAFGGMWESVVKSTKFHIRRVVGETVFTYEEFLTLLKQIEAILNSRPLCAQADDVTDPLTPSHFIVGHSLSLVPEPNMTHLKLSRLSRWQMIQQMAQHFWKRWNGEYLTTLNQMAKHNRENRAFQVGDLVFVRDENLPPSKYALGRITELHPGQDKLTRVVTLKLSKNQQFIKRPISKLCLLPKFDTYESMPAE